MLTDFPLYAPVGVMVPVFKALADETRLAILRMLALCDMRAGEIVARVGAPQNAVSYHLRQLRAVGLLRDHRSSSDARDIYYSIDHDHVEKLLLDVSDLLRPGLVPRHESEEVTEDTPLRVLFLCTHNSARSQLAEGLLRYMGGDGVEVSSAGSDPAAEVHPAALSALAELGIDTARHYPKLLDPFVGQCFDYVITVCDRVRDSCPIFPGDPQQIHWSFPDPTVIEDAAARRRAFDEIRLGLTTRIRYLLQLPHPATGRRLRPVGDAE